MRFTEIVHHGSRLPRGTCLVVIALSLAPAGAIPVEIPVTYDSNKGLFNARVHVGSPPQELWATIDSASPWFWIPTASDNKSHGFHVEDGVDDKKGVIDSLKYAEGVTVNGYRTTVKVKLGDGEVQHGPFLLVKNISKQGIQLNLSTLKGVGMLGLSMRDEEAQLERYQTQRIFEFFSSSEETRAKASLNSFFKAFWQEHPDIPKTFFLSFAGSEPRMVVGTDLQRGPDAFGLKLLANSFTRESELWYAPIRAIGFSLSAGGGSGTLVWNLDFNQFQWGGYGAPARLDTATDSIVVSHVLFEHFIQNIADGQCVMNNMRGMDCPCNQGAIDEIFPWISISFETADTYRFLGFDTGADTRSCIPPSAYVTPSGKVGMCSLAIVDGGPYQRFFGREGIVLGVPFFRAVSVGFDVERRRISVKNVPRSQASVPADGQSSAASESSLQSDGMPVAASLGASRNVCPCADPKNWWQVGHRFSLWRVVVVLISVSMLLSYVYVGYSPSAAGIRNQLEQILGPGSPTQNTASAHVQMTGQGGGQYSNNGPE